MERGLWIDWGERKILKKMEKNSFEVEWGRKVENAVEIKNIQLPLNKNGIRKFINDYSFSNFGNNRNNNNNVNFKLYYNSFRQYESMAKSLGMISDVKDGVPRGAFKGTVPIRIDNKLVYLVQNK